MPGDRGRVPARNCTLPALPGGSVQLPCTRFCGKGKIDAESLRGDILGDLPNSSLNKLELHFLPLSKRNMETDNLVLAEWVLEAIRGPDPSCHTWSRLAALPLPAHLQSWGRKGPKACGD